MDLTWVKSTRRTLCETGDVSDMPFENPGLAKIVSLADETTFATNGIVSRTLLRTADLKVVLFCMAEGQEMSEHTSTQAGVVHILSGECEFVLAGKTHVAKPGDLIFMPPNLPHAVRATRQFSMLLTLSKGENPGAKP